MDRLSRASLWTLVAAALTAPGCADVLGFKDFADDTDGGGSNTANPSQGQGTGGGTTNPGGGTGNSGGSMGSQAGGGSTGSNTGTSTSPSSGGSGGGGSASGSGGTASSGGSSHAGGSGGGGTGASSSSTSSGTGTGASSSSSMPSSSGPTPACMYASIPEPGGGSTSSSNSGSATEYYFGQCSGCFVGSTYKTACGYAGTEPTATGNFSSVDVVPNAASMSPASDMYFAAIPGMSSPGSNATDYSTFNTVGACGACVELSANGKSIVATLIDECPSSSNAPCQAAGHLDLSTTAFGALGYNQGQGGDPSGLSWQFVACPVSGNIKASLNSAGQVYFQNAVFPITSIMVGGQSATLTVYGYWQFPGNASGANVTLNDVQGDSVSLTLPTIASWPSSTDIGAQFMKPTGSCP